MKTEETNKLIAEFMGCENPYAWELIPSPYEVDWNWLMEVVEKIETIEELRFLFQISSRQGFYAEVRERLYYNEKIEDSWGNTRIEAVYKTCVNFIKWYNKQKSA